MTHPPWHRSLAVAVLAFLLGGVAPARAATDGIDVSGTELIRNGRPWVPKGVVVTGLVAPKAALLPRYRPASEHYGPRELDAIAGYGADLVRFQVSQAGNDPQSPIFSANYSSSVVQAVALARQHGFAVIVSMQAEAPSGLDEKGMPSDATLRAWRTLAPSFAGDTGVMLELFNEPAPFGPTPHDWSGWLRTTQPLVDAIRGLGAGNVLIADGLRWARTLDGAPPLADPLNRIVYAVHPYLERRNRTKADWDRAFGEFAATHPVLATEWNAWSRLFCFAGMADTAADLLTYLREKRIGLVAWSFDLTATLVADYDWTPTSLDGLRCGKNESFGAGHLVHRYFEGLPLTPTAAH